MNEKNFKMNEKFIKKEMVSTSIMLHCWSPCWDPWSGNSRSEAAQELFIDLCSSLEDKRDGRWDLEGERWRWDGEDWEWKYILKNERWEHEWGWIINV